MSCYHLTTNVHSLLNVIITSIYVKLKQPQIMTILKNPYLNVNYRPLIHNVSWIVILRNRVATKHHDLNVMHQIANVMAKDVMIYHKLEELHHHLQKDLVQQQQLH